MVSPSSTIKQQQRAICLWKMVTGQADICNKLMQVDSLFKIHDTMIDIGEELKKQIDTYSFESKAQTPLLFSKEHKLVVN